MKTRRALLKSACAAGLVAAFPRMLHVAGASEKSVNLYVDDNLAAYGFPEGHPFGIDRQGAFLREADEWGLLERASRQGSREALRDEIARFHSAGYLELVSTAEERGLSLLDAGDTPVFPGVYRTSAHVVGAAHGDAGGHVRRGTYHGVWRRRL